VPPLPGLDFFFSLTQRFRAGLPLFRAWRRFVLYDFRFSPPWQQRRSGATGLSKLAFENKKDGPSLA